MNQFRSLEFAKITYKECAGLDLPRHLKDQLLRASSSVALNLAEGRGRRTNKEQLHFFSISYGSLQEVKIILELANLTTSPAFRFAHTTGGLIYALMKNIKT